jgi:hypothetical protein
VRRRGRTLTARLSAGGRPLADRELSLGRRLRGRSTWRTTCARRTIVLAARTAEEHPAARSATAATASASAGGAAGVTSTCALRTDAAGRVVARLRRGPSRTVRVAFAGDAQLLPARDSIAIRTPARIRVRARPKSVAAGGTTRFTGRLLGGHVPRGGKLVELQARVAAGWRTFTTLRTDRRGRFAHPHRFSPLSGGRTFWVRVRVRPEATYPFERATARPLAVRVR